ncbi:MAG: class I SAM-dependent methyltransferase [Cellulosilyticaceae bacterium]
MEKIIQLCTSTLENGTFITGTWSNPRTKQDAYEKCTVKPVILKDVPYVQFTFYKDNKAYHHNVGLEDVSAFITEHCTNFKQLQLFTAMNDFAMLINKKGQANIKKLPPTKECPTCFTHNRQKTYVLDDTNAKAFLVQLGLMSEDGKVKPSKYDKYKQINKYLETIEAVMKDFKNDFIRIIDFGCGKSYLTFAMYYYLTEILGKSVEIVGLDLKEDVITFCNKLSEELGYTKLKFQVGDIGQYTTNQQIDMVVSLHACNIATDAAISKAVGWDAKIILAVPCCHHECYTQIQNPMLAPILKHGILKERIAALVTDGLRGQLLESVGYKVSIMEFIDMQHTPKNILIKAIKSSDHFDASAYETYQTLCKELYLDLSLPKFLGDKLS